MSIGNFNLLRGPYAQYQHQAIVGMKVDSMNDNVDTLACAIEDDEILGFGLVVTWVLPRNAGAGGPSPQNDLGVVPGGPVAGYRGICIHDHIIGSRGGYLRYDAVSVLTRGRVWAHVANPAGIEDGVPVFYDPGTGEVQAAGGLAVPNALFRSIAISLPDTAQQAWSGGMLTDAAIVELHHPRV